MATQRMVLLQGPPARSLGAPGAGCIVRHGEQKDICVGIQCVGIQLHRIPDAVKT